jgi:hypothetical protein
MPQFESYCGWGAVSCIIVWLWADGYCIIGAVIVTTPGAAPASASHERTTLASTLAVASVTSASVIGAAAAARAVVLASCRREIAVLVSLGIELGSPTS